MKNLILFFSMACCATFLSAQEIDCESICIENIAYNDTTGLLEVTVNNGSDDFINYPIIMVEVEGEIVANWDSTFVFFGQPEQSTVVHELETSLTSVPVDFTCTVYLIDGLWDVICTLPYPCIPDDLAEIPKLQLMIYPNPVKDILQITSNELIQSVEIFSVEGKILFRQSFNSESILLNTEELASGTYFILCRSEHAAMKQFINRE